MLSYKYLMHKCTIKIVFDLENDSSGPSKFVLLNKVHLNNLGAMV